MDNPPKIICLDFIKAEALCPTVSTTDSSTLDIFLPTTTHIGPFKSKIIPSGLELEMPEQTLVTFSKPPMWEKEKIPLELLTDYLKISLQGGKSEIGVCLCNYSGKHITLKSGFPLVRLKILDIKLCDGVLYKFTRFVPQPEEQDAVTRKGKARDGEGSRWLEKKQSPAKRKNCEDLAEGESSTSKAATPADKSLREERRKSPASEQFAPNEAGFSMSYSPLSPTGSSTSSSEISE